MPRFPLLLSVAAIFIALSGGYAIIIELWRPKFAAPQDQWQANVITAERFLIENKAAAVIVGSSVAARLNQAELGPRIYNLGFSGGSAQTGLALVCSLREKPQLIAIEVNFIDRPIDNNFLADLENPVRLSLKRHIRALRTDAHPLSLLLGALRGQAGASPSVAMPPDVLQKLIATQLERAVTPVNPTTLSRTIFALKTALKELESSKIVFFEMPEDDRLMKSPELISRREALIAAFPKSSYKWLVPDAKIRYETTDGVHLAQESADGFSLTMREFLTENF